MIFMGLNGISVWQWCVILVVFVVAIIAAPGIARSRRASLGGRRPHPRTHSDEEGEKDE